jgi:hypothetical protein
MKAPSNFVRLLRIAGVVIAIMVNSTAATLTWIGGNGDWSIPSNWDGARVPSLFDVAVINSGVVAADWESTVTGLTLTGGRLEGVGEIRVTGNFTWTGGSMGSSFGFGKIIVEASGTATFAGPADKDLGRLVENRGALTWTDGRLVFSQGTLLNTGLMTIGHDARLVSNGGMTGTFHNAGTLFKSSVGEMILDGVAFQQFGAMNANGTIRTVGGVFETHGTFSPGVGIGAANITGNLRQTPGGTLRVELSGSNSCDKLAVTGEATLRGTLKVELVNGFVPAEGEKFTVLEFGSRAGAFDAMAGLAVTSDLFLEPTLSETNLILTTKKNVGPNFTMSRFENKSGAFALTVSNIAGQTFILEARDAFETRGGWEPILTNANSSVVYDFIDNDRINHAARFFRVKLATQ